MSERGATMTLGQARLGGVLGGALDANLDGRLKHFIVDATSPAIALFAPAHVAVNREGDWYGEHAGKWLYAAARAAKRAGDSMLAARVLGVADFLVEQQGPDGYLGTYAPDRRFMCQQPAAARTWDGAPAQRTWDVWTHTYLILGLLEVHRHFPNDRYLDAARRIGDLCWRVLGEGGIDITSLGNHFGMSATVLLDAAVELYMATRDEKYLRLAKLILQQADARPELQLLTQAAAGTDAAEIATGKAYQLCWNLVALAKLSRATGEDSYQHAARRVWASIRDHHLTLGGGPWGGVGHRSREVFNHRSVFSPLGYVETCSLLAWIQLNRELLLLTGNCRYADEIERTAYNDLLGAQASNGEDWCYYSFPNGQRVHTTYWRCCKSSGAMALEELPPLACTTRGDDIAINLYGPCVATVTTAASGAVRIEQATRYPFDGEIRMTIHPQRTAKFAILVRIPAHCAEATISINGLPYRGSALPGSFVELRRSWQQGDAILLQLSMAPTLHRRSSSSVQESKAPEGTPVAQEVMRYDYMAITRGPLVYATGPIDGFKSAETLQVGPNELGSLEVVTPRDGAPPIRWHLGYRPPLTFEPYYAVGGRQDGAWRLSWMQVVPR